MFSYYGSKANIAKFYPKPKFELIIEPFAGAAWYSFLYKENKILLNEKYDVLFGIWNWLINESNKEIILNNSNFYIGQDISQLNLPKEYLNLIGFCINPGSESPRKIVQKRTYAVKSKPNWSSRANFQLNRIANNLDYIKKWNILFGDYKNIENVEATWFIDPPYINGGKFYKENNINYEELSDWCKSRKGQVIVCENNNANWLDFKPLITVKGQINKFHTETIWTNE